MRLTTLIKIIGLFALAGLGVYLMLCSWPLPNPQALVADLPAATPPDEMAVYKIVTGVNHRTAAFAYRGGSFSDKRDFSMIALLVKHPKGDLLIDAGFGRNIKEHFKQMPFYFRAVTDFDPGRAAADQLTEAGYNQQNLSAILLTHAHWDHVSGIEDFSETPVLVNSDEHRYIFKGKWSGLIRSFNNVHYKQYVFNNVPYLNFAQSCDLYGDGSIVIVPAPGHTPGSVIIFLVLPSGQRFAMIGDLAWQREGVLLREERPWLQCMMGDDNPAQVRENLLRMAAIAERFPQITIVPAHDARGFEHIPELNTMKITE